MKQVTHTQGPWELVQERDYLNLQEKDTNLVIAQFMGASDEDARLIASAPELLEMCKLFEDCMANLDGASEPFDTSYELSKVRAVLAKVEGESV
jgi:hypothetical protein